MAVWDAVAKIAGKPLFRLLAARHGLTANPRVFVYAAGGYYYPGKGLSMLRGEMRGYLDRGYSVVKMKIGGAPLDEDRRRIEAVLGMLGKGQRLAVDANDRLFVAESGGEGLGVAKFIYDESCLRLDELCKPYLSVVKIDKSRTGEQNRDGEIVAYGANVMMGYHNKPDQNETLQTGQYAASDQTLQV